MKESLEREGEEKVKGWEREEITDEKLVIKRFRKDRIQ